MSKYQRIITDILQAIDRGEFQRGQKLPSVRQLSQHYQCSKDTVQKAMLELKYQNKLYAVEKSGYYILEDKAFQEETVRLNPADFQQLPYENFRTCVHESLIGREIYLFNYYHQQEGLEDLISSLYRLLMDYAVYAKKDQIVVTSGSQQALYILANMTFPTKASTILLETPTYHRMEELVEELRLPYRTLERTLTGIDLTELERQFQRGDIKFFYTISRLHNPLGTSYTMEEKQAIIRLAHQYDVYIVEDDYLADFDSDNNLPLHYLDTENQVIYIKSFTTTLFPALRIGGVVLPQQLIPAFLQYKRLIDYDTNLIMQKALSLYIDNGMFARNTQLLQLNYHKQISQMTTCVKQQLPLFPYQLTRDKLVLQVPPTMHLARIKHSPLPIQLIETPSHTYVLLTWTEQFQEDYLQLLEFIQS